MKKRAAATALVVLALVVGGVAMSRSPTPSEYQIPTDLHFFSAWFRCPTGIDDNLRNYVSWAVPENRVVVGLQEKDPITGEWAHEQYVYSTSYQVLDVAFRLGGQELYVSGVQVDGSGYTDVIEKWVFPTPAGGYSVTLGGGVTPIGTPRGPLSGSTGILGGNYVAPNGRISTRQPVPGKSIIYSAPAGGHIDSIAADPEGRFLLLHNYTTGSVLSLDLSVSSATPQVVFSTAQNPVLSAARTMVMHDVPGVGRICRLTAENRHGAYPSGTTATTILVDSQNDGIFEAFTVHPSVQIARGQTPYGETTDWQSVVNFGWDWKAEYL